MIKKLIKDGHEVIVLTTKDEYTHLLEKLGCGFENIEFKSNSINPLSELKILLKSLLHIKKISPDILLTFTIKPNIYGSLIARYLEIPCISNIAGLGISHSNKFLRNIIKTLYKISLSANKRCFFQNPVDLDYFLKNKIINEKKVGLLPGSGVDTKYFKATDEMIMKRKKSISFNFVLSARLLWSKGIQEYINAAKAIKKDYDNVNFWLVGFSNVDNKDSINISHINTWHNEGIITFKGKTDDVRFYLGLANCFVLPSYYPEGTPKSLLEAASMQLPIITTDTPGCRDVIKNEITGYLCKEKDFNDLYSKMKSILTLTSGEVEQMGKSARMHIKNNFDDRIVTNIYLDTVKSYSGVRK